MRRSPRLALGLALGATLLTAACATTRGGVMGPLENTEPLVTLVVTKDKSLIQDHCRGAVAVGPILGCQVTRVTSQPDGQTVKVIKIVRYTDALPSAVAFEIDLHELCHAAATLQSVADPCHKDNHGFLQASPRAVMQRR